MCMAFCIKKIMRDKNKPNRTIVWLDSIILQLIYLPNQRNFFDIKYNWIILPHIIFKQYLHNLYQAHQILLFKNQNYISHDFFGLNFDICDFIRQMLKNHK